MAACSRRCDLAALLLVLLSYSVANSKQTSLSRDDKREVRFGVHSFSQDQLLQLLKPLWPTSNTEDAHRASSGIGNTLKHKRGSSNGDSKSSVGAKHEQALRKKISKHQKTTADANFNFVRSAAQMKNVNDGEIVTYNPGDKAPAFSLFVLGGVLKFPSPELSGQNLMFHVYDPNAGFIDAMWGSTEALVYPLAKLPNNTHIIFMSSVPPDQGLKTALWMKEQIMQGFEKLPRSSPTKFSAIADRLHFVVTPVKALGNWIPTVFKQWMCVDHNCGYSQVVIQSPDIEGALVLKRLDARYDWLPSPEIAFPNKKTVPLTDASNGCLPSSSVNGSVAYVSSDGCSFYTKVAAMQKSGAVGVLVTSDTPGHLKDMNCEEEECSTPLQIPASMAPGTPSLIGDKKKVVFYQTTPSDNFHFAIDSLGNLTEVGWWLFPSLKFLVWEAEWLVYKSELNRRLDQTAMVLPVFKSQAMQGQAGVVVNVTLPPMEKLKTFGKVELDMSLSCPGTRDTTCAHWDHTIQLFICCQGRPPQFCELEIGRWISPFRRRVGRWLTDITPLLPLFTGPSCTFTMKTAPWALPWIPSLNLRFSQPRSQGLYPSSVLPLYHPGATFDHKYNSNFQPVQFTVPPGVKQVQIYSVITGHGSDENGCGEFCVTSHHFRVNNVTSNITFSNAGTPEGCADHVPGGVIPNEHGTWLYGRDGWCDGQQVDGWRIDVTDQVSLSADNQLQYYGWFNGTDPNPKENPGVMILWSYLVYYTPL